VTVELAGPAPSAKEVSLPGTLPETISEFMEQHLAGYMSGFADKLPPDGLYDRVLHQMEPPLIRAVLAATRGNQLKAAEVLGINRNTLRVKIKQHQIKALRGFA
jgi:two-component system nitrogen regulation response regulator GlnG